MDSLVEAKVLDYLTQTLHIRPAQAPNVLQWMRELARVRGYEVDERFGELGSSDSAGPEAQVAAAIVQRALGKGGTETSDYEVRKQLEQWVVRLPHCHL